MATQIYVPYSTFKAASANLKVFYVQNSSTYTAVCVSSDFIFTCLITAGSDVSDFESNIKPTSVLAATKEDAVGLAALGAGAASLAGAFNDPRVIHRLGNLTSASTSDVLVSAATYTEQSSQAQRSVVSSSANDADPSGSGAKVVRIVYLDSNYVLKTEDVALNGTNAVNTSNTDIRFIEKFFVIKGAAAAGAITLKATTGGGGATICTIGSATTDAFMCHHYIPAGKIAYVLGWGYVVDDDAALKLIGQSIISGNRVDQILDLDKSGSITSPGRVGVDRSPKGISLAAKTYCRVNVVPGQSSSTVIRAYLDIWEGDSL